MTERRREAELLKDKLDDEEVDLGWIYPVSKFAEGHRVGWWWVGIYLLFAFHFQCLPSTKET